MKEDLRSLRIDRNKKRRQEGTFWKVSTFLLLLCVLLLAAFLFFLKEPAEDLAPTPAVSEANDDPLPIAEERSREVLIASGYVIAHHKHELGSKVMGRVEWIGVEKGDFVRKGQLLVKLEDREYRAQLDQAQAALKAAKERYEELSRGSRPEEIEKGRAELARARAEEENARLEFERLDALLEAGVVSPQEVDNARARYTMAKASVGVAQRSYELLELGPREEQVAQAAAEMERERANVAYAQTMLDATEIRAPITGTVLRRIAEIGEMITTSFAGTSGAKSAVVALADLDDLQVELDISQSDFKRISTDQKCLMTPEAFPDRDYACEIDEIAPEANRQKASIQVKVKVLEPDEYLRPEMSARVTFSRRE